MTFFALVHESLLVMSLNPMSAGSSLIVAGGDGIAGEGSKVDKDKSNDVGTSDWGIKEMTEPEEPI